MMVILNFLSNQGFEVLDANMKPCPDMVQGELYITGKEIYSILISVLKVDALYPDDNLFELGADSLLMAQIAGRVKEIIEQTKTSVTFDEILRQILNNPTGEAITTFVKSKQNILTSENVRTDDFRIIEKTAKDTVYIFFHTALGTTNCYRFVEKELRKEDLGDFLFINVEDVEWYYSIQYHELVDRITDEYVRKIEQLHYKNINLILLLVKIFEECARKQESRKVVFLTHFLICLPWLVFLKLEAKYIIRIVWILLDIQSNWKKCIGTKVQKMKRLYFGLV